LWSKWQKSNLNLHSMNGLLKLKPYIGSEKTLVISSSTFGFEKYAEFQDRIFIHLIPGSRLLRYDPQQREILQDHVESKSCSQLIFVGSNDQQLMDQIQTGDSLYSLKSALTFNLKPLLRARHEKAIDPVVKMQMLIELNVISQCKLLMDYFFIKEKVEKNKLHVRGVVTEMKSEQLKSIFHNGIGYNDILTLN
jgi:hypothetical protein